MLATVDAADSASTVIKKYSVFIYSEAEPHAMYAIYINRRVHCVFYSIQICKLVILLNLQDSSNHFTNNIAIMF